MSGFGIMAAYAYVAYKSIVDWASSLFKNTHSMPAAMGFRIDKISKCELFEFNHNSDAEKQISFVELDIGDISAKLKKMESCKRIYTGYISHNKHLLKLTFDDSTEKTIALSDDGNFLGYPGSRSSYNYWYYLEKEQICDLIKQ